MFGGRIARQEVEDLVERVRVRRIEREVVGGGRVAVADEDGQRARRGVFGNPRRHDDAPRAAAEVLQIDPDRHRVARPHALLLRLDVHDARALQPVGVDDLDLDALDREVLEFVGHEVIREQGERADGLFPRRQAREDRVPSHGAGRSVSMADFQTIVRSPARFSSVVRTLSVASASRIGVSIELCTTSNWNVCVGHVLRSHLDRDGDHRRRLAEAARGCRSSDPARPSPSTRSRRGELEGAVEGREHRQDVGARHRHVDRAHREERVAEREDRVAVDPRHGARSPTAPCRPREARRPRPSRAPDGRIRGSGSSSVESLAAAGAEAPEGAASQPAAPAMRSKSPPGARVPENETGSGSAASAPRPRARP